MELVGSPMTHGLPNYLPHIVQRVSRSYLSDAAKPLYSLFNAITPSVKQNELEAFDVFSLEFIRSGHLAHLLKGFKEILLSLNYPENLPGPGNGYYEAIFLFFGSLEQTIHVENMVSIDHQDVMKAFIFHDQEALIFDKEMKYPPEILFYAIRLTSPIIFAANDLWTLFQKPSKKLQYQAERLLASFEFMTKTLRRKNIEEFREIFPLFDQTWEEFLLQLVAEKSTIGSEFSPSTKLCMLIHNLIKTSINQKNRQFKQQEIEKISKLLSEVKPKQIYIHIKYFLERKLNWLESESLFKSTLRKICQDPLLKHSIDPLIKDKFSDFKVIVTQLSCLHMLSCCHQQKAYPVIFAESSSVIDQIHHKIDQIDRLSSGKILNTLRKFILKLPAKTTEEKKIYALVHELALDEDFDRLYLSVSNEQEYFLNSIQKELMEKFKIITLDVNIRLWLAAEKMRELAIVTFQPRMHDGNIQEESLHM